MPQNDLFEEEQSRNILIVLLLRFIKSEATSQLTKAYQPAKENQNLTYEHHEEFKRLPLVLKAYNYLDQLANGENPDVPLAYCGLNKEIVEKLRIAGYVTARPLIGQLLRAPSNLKAKGFTQQEVQMNIFQPMFPFSSNKESNRE